MKIKTFLGAIFASEKTLLVRTLLAIPLAMFFAKFLGKDILALLDVFSKSFISAVSWAAFGIAFTALFLGISGMLRKHSGFFLIGMAVYFPFFGAVAVVLTYGIFRYWGYHFVDASAIKELIAGMDTKVVEQASVWGNKNFWAIIAAIATTLLHAVFGGTEQSAISKVCAKIKKVILLVLGWAVRVLSPWVVFASVAKLSTNGDFGKLWEACGGIVGLVWLGNFLQTSLLCGFAWFAVRVSPWRLWQAFKEAFVVGFATGSSKLALVKLFEGLRNLGLPQENAEFLGTTSAVLNMDGTALYSDFI